MNDRPNTDTEKQFPTVTHNPPHTDHTPTVCYPGGVEIEFDEPHSPLQVAGRIRVVLEPAGHVTGGELAGDPTEIPVPAQKVRGVCAPAVCDNSIKPGFFVKPGRLSAYLKVAEAVGIEKASAFSHALHDVYHQTLSWGDPNLWAAVAQRWEPLETPPEVLASAIGAADTDDVSVSRFQVSDGCGASFYQSTRGILRHVAEGPEFDPDGVPFGDALTERADNLLIGETIRAHFEDSDTPVCVTRLRDTGPHIRDVAPSLWQRRQDLRGEWMKDDFRAYCQRDQKKRDSQGSAEKQRIRQRTGTEQRTEPDPQAEKCDRWARVVKAQSGAAAASLRSLFDTIAEAESDIGDAMYPVWESAESLDRETAEKMIRWLKAIEEDL